MTRVTHGATGFALIFMLSACSGSESGTPTRPGSVQSATPGPSAGPQGPSSISIGTVALRQVTPDPGSPLPVRTCFLGSVTRECSEAWSGTFEVTVDREVAWPVFTISFFDGTTLCGYAAATLASNRLPAGVPTTFQPSKIFLTDEFGTFSPSCALPARATRMIAELWTDADWSISLKQEFAISYTFVKP